MISQNNLSNLKNQLEPHILTREQAKASNPTQRISQIIYPYLESSQSLYYKSVKEP